MERIFDNEDAKELRKGTFKVNLGKEDGLAGIIIDIRESVKYKDLEDEEDPNYRYKRIYDDMGIDLDPKTGEISISSEQSDLRKAIKQLVKDKALTYEKK